MRTSSIGFEYGRRRLSLLQALNILSSSRPAYAPFSAVPARRPRGPTASSSSTAAHKPSILANGWPMSAEKQVDLTPKEFDLLELLLRSQNCVFSREIAAQHRLGLRLSRRYTHRWTCIFRRLRESLRPIPPSPNISSPNGAWDITTRSDHASQIEKHRSDR